MATALAPRLVIGPACLRARCHLRRGAGDRRRGGRPVRPPPVRAASPTRIWPRAPADQRAGAAVSLLAFARRRLPGVAKVRVFNTTADHGFESRHTIVQIVNDDMPFLVDSIANEFNRREIASICWRIRCWRCAATSMAIFWASPSKPASARESESMMHIEIDRQADPALLDELAAALTRVLAEVRLAVEDWRAMRRACLDAIADLAASRSPSLAEYDDFLRWLEADHFTFLGHRRYRYVDDAAPAGRPALRPRAGLARSASCVATRCGCSRPASAAARRCRASPAGRTTS